MADLKLLSCHLRKLATFPKAKSHFQQPAFDILKF